jgi:hypothetical protein
MARTEQSSSPGERYIFAVILAAIYTIEAIAILASAAPMTPDFAPGMSRSSANPLRDPEGYLAAQKFSRKIVCPRTGLPVSFADLGEEDGVPVLWVLPSGCSRWVAAAQGVCSVSSCCDVLRETSGVLLWCVS